MMVSIVLEFVNLHQDVPHISFKRKSYEEKLLNAKHEKASRLLNIAIEKKSNLICAADLSDTASILKLAEEIGVHICALKLHADILEDFSYDFISSLKALAEKHQFLLFEDRKFADIGHTQRLQFEKGIYQISNWADLITTHLISGEKSLDAFASSEAGIVSIIEMSSEGALTNKNYIDAAKRMAMNHSQIIGGVAQSRLPEELLLFTPGVNFEKVSDDLGQQYHTPEKVFHEYETDFVIVGRGIYSAENPAKAAQKYRQKAWGAYEKTL